MDKLMEYIPPVKAWDSRYLAPKSQKKDYTITLIILGFVFSAFIYFFVQPNIGVAEGHTDPAPSKENVDQCKKILKNKIATTANAVDYCRTITK